MEPHVYLLIFMARTLKLQILAIHAEFLAIRIVGTYVPSPLLLITRFTSNILIEVHIISTL